MENKPVEKPRVALDATVLFAGSVWPRRHHPPAQSPCPSFVTKRDQVHDLSQIGEVS